jgi:hypothetical protein
VSPDGSTVRHSTAQHSTVRRRCISTASLCVASLQRAADVAAGFIHGMSHVLYIGVSSQVPPGHVMYNPNPN